MKLSRYRLPLISVAVFLLLLFWIRHKPKKHEILITEPTKSSPATISAPPLKKDNRPFYGPLPSHTDIKDLPMSNKPSPEWLSKLEVHIKKIGGKRLKDFKLTPEESYIIPDGPGGRYVERVHVRVEGDQGEFNSFFAEVDSQTGHVLKTWGSVIPEKRTH